MRYTHYTWIEISSKVSLTTLLAFYNDKRSKNEYIEKKFDIYLLNYHVLLDYLQRLRHLRLSIVILGCIYFCNCTCLKILSTELFLYMVCDIYLPIFDYNTGQQWKTFFLNFRCPGWFGTDTLLAVMSVQRFRSLFRCLRFVDICDHAQRREIDQLAALRELLKILLLPTARTTSVFKNTQQWMHNLFLSVD